METKAGVSPELPPRAQLVNLTGGYWISQMIGVAGLRLARVVPTESAVSVVKGVPA